MSADILGTTWDKCEAWFNIALRPRKPEGSLGRTAQHGHLESHTAPGLCGCSMKTIHRYCKWSWHTWQVLHHVPHKDQLFWLSTKPLASDICYIPIILVPLASKLIDGTFYFAVLQVFMTCNIWYILFVRSFLVHQ